MRPEFPDALPDPERRAGARAHRAWLCRAHLGAGGRAGSRSRTRPAGLRPHRLRQDGGVRPGDGHGTAGRGRTGGARWRAAGAGDRAHARTGAAGAGRAGMALCGGRRPRGVLRRRHGPARRVPPDGPGLPYRGGHAGPPARPYRAQPARSLRLARGGAGRGRRDARPRLPRGPGIHPERRAAGAPHAAVQRNLRPRDRRPGARLPARCDPHRHGGPLAPA